MGITRKPFEGVLNIIRFNWHLYLLAIAGTLLALFTAIYFKGCSIFYLIAAASFATSMISLLVSFYVYDLSGLYDLTWIKSSGDERVIINIHAGFDETSDLIRCKFPQATLEMIDFYDPQKHTELSIKRARKIYPAPPQTLRADAEKLPIATAAADKIFVIFSAHEIRDKGQRTAFFRELARVIKPGCEIHITEHLRDATNFIAYNFGFLHFYSRQSWVRLFEDAGLKLDREVKTTPFISTFIISR